MTDLQLLYLQARAGRRRGHRAAVEHVAAQTGLDGDTVARCLHRARRADERDAKVRS
jgi:uncharacterized membrane protein